MANVPALTKKESQYLASSIYKAGDLIERFVTDEGVPVEMARRQILQELIWREAIPFNKDTQQFELGSWKAIDMIMASEPKNETGGSNELESLLLKIAEKVESSKNEKNLIAPNDGESHDD
jgi:hypothetical protein